MVVVLILFFCSTTHASITQVNMQSGVIQSNGNMIMAGYGTISNTPNFLLSRFNTNGSLDTSFGTNGIVTTSIGTRAEAGCIVLQSSGNSIVAGFAIVNNSTQFAVARYTTTGALDSSFGNAGTGIVTQAIGAGCAINACVLQTDGSIIVAGNCVMNGQPQIALMRFTSNGLVDTTFGTKGIVTLSVSGGPCACQAVVIQTNGLIVVGGSAVVNSVTQMVMARFNTNGTLDTTFGTSGIVTSAQGSRSVINALSLDASGNIVAVGFSDSNMISARFSSSGSLDTSFGTAGVTITTVGTTTRANSVVIDSSSAIVVAGYSDTNLLLARFTSAGILDSSFATNGIALNIVQGQAQANDVLLQTNGEILAVGVSSGNGVSVLYTTAGVVDTSWGSFGISAQSSDDTLVTRIWEQEPVGTNGGSFIAGAWQTRVLNSINAASAVSLSSNQFILPPGAYTISIMVPAYQVANHQARLQDVTNNMTLLWGTSVYSNTSKGSLNYSIIEGEIFINQSTKVQVQHRCTATQLNDGLGIAAGIGAAEIYTTVKIISL